MFRVVFDKLERLCYNWYMAKYTLLKVENGIEYRQYENGAIRNQNGQIIQLPDDSPLLTEHAITSDNAHTYHQMRKDKILKAIENRVMDVTKTNIPAEAIGAIVGKRAEIAMKDDTRIGNEAAKIVLSAIDAYQDKAETRTDVRRQELVMDDNTRLLLERLIEAKRRDVSTNVLDGSVDVDV